MSDPASLQSALQSRLGYQFRDPALLTRALTHRSHDGDNNERLEYLGDSILGFVIAEALFTRFPNVAEGDLTRMRSHLVRQKTLATQARDMQMQPCMLLGASELKSGVCDRDSILADAFEALIGAIYLDSDLSTVKDVVHELFAQQLEQISPDNPKDAKTQLQEHLQKRGLPLPTYEVVEKSGKPHAMTFVVACTVSGLSEPATASGRSRRDAEQDAANKVLTLLNMSNKHV